MSFSVVCCFDYTVTLCQKYSTLGKFGILKDNESHILKVVLISLVSIQLEDYVFASVHHFSCFLQNNFKKTCGLSLNIRRGWP